MKSKIIESQVLTTGKMRTHLERPGCQKTFCGQIYSSRWITGADVDIMTEDKKVDCESCNRAAKWLKKRIEKGVSTIEPSSRYSLPDWCKSLNTRASNGVKRIMIFELRVATFRSIDDFSEQEVKDALNKAIDSKLIPSDLCEIQSIGRISSKEINKWLGRSGKIGAEMAIKTCIQIMMEKGIPSLAYEEAMKVWGLYE